MTIKVFSNPKSFVNDAKKHNITLDYINEAIESIGKQKVVKMFEGKSNRGANGCLSSATLDNWLVTFEFVKNNPEKEDNDKFTGVKEIKKIGSSWDDYIKLIKTPIEDDVIKSWCNMSKPKLIIEAEKYGVTLGIKNAESLKKYPLIDKLNDMVKRRRELFWNKSDIEEDVKEESEKNVNYNLINVPTLHQLCKERNIVSHFMKKDDMVLALENYDKREPETIENNYEDMTNQELKNICKQRGFSSYNRLNKDSLIKKLTDDDNKIKEIKKVSEEVCIVQNKKENDIVLNQNDILETFKFENKEVRTTGTFEDPWFVAKDICDILELSNNRTSLNNIPIEWKDVKNFYTLGGNQQMTIINEAGLYKLIMRSNKPNAERFQKWICEDVLPSIRKYGTYSIGNKYEEKFNQINMLIKDSSIEDKLNMNELDKEAEELEKVFEWFKFSNCICLYLAYIGNGLLKLGFSSCGLIDREKKHMSSESEFEQFRVIKAYKISSGKIETIIKDLLVRYRVKFNKQFEIYKPNKSLQEFCEMTETLLLDNDLKYQLDIALKRAEDAEKKVVELERQLNKM